VQSYNLVISRHYNFIDARATAASLPIFLTLELRQIPTIVACYNMRSLGIDVAVSRCKEPVVDDIEVHKL
jgi:hypothetical protein